MKRWILIGIVVLIYVGTNAQQKKALFRSQNYIGLLEGDDGSAFQFNTINGVQLGTWYAGVGTGLDWYMFRSVPLFLSINKDWKPSNRTFYFNLDAGTNFVWTDEGRNDWTGYESKFTPGFYWGAGIGYKAGFKNKKDAIVFNLGYSFKRLKEEETVPLYCINPPCGFTTDYYDYKTNRVSVRMGWQF